MKSADEKLIEAAKLLEECSKSLRTCVALAVVTKGWLDRDAVVDLYDRVDNFLWWETKWGGF